MDTFFMITMAITVGQLLVAFVLCTLLWVNYDRIVERFAKGSLKAARIIQKDTIEYMCETMEDFVGMAEAKEKELAEQSENE